MQINAILGCLLAAGLLIGGQARAQVIYYNTASSVLSQNTIARASTNDGGNSLLFTATGPGSNNVFRCTAMAVDALNGEMFLLDGVSNALWSLNLGGGSLNLIASGLTNYPTDLALDALNKEVYFTTSSTVQSNNTVQRVDYSGNNHAILYIATGSEEDADVSRCTAIAVDLGNSKIFIADAGTRKIWSLNLAGGGVTVLTTATNATPTSLALDVNNRQVYFTLSSTAQNSNVIRRMNYDGTGLITLFTASGSVQRCTALDLDLAQDNIYLSDAGAGNLWRVPLSGGAATTVLTGLPAVARKVRWYGGPDSLVPGLMGFNLAGTSVVFRGSNGFAGGTYYVLTSTNLQAPLARWTTIATNLLDANGFFTLTATNAVRSKAPRQFFILRAQ